MGKKILKEMFIIALLVVVIIIILIGLLYDYIPTEQSVQALPEPIEYMADSTVTSTLQEIKQNETTYSLEDITNNNTNTTSTNSLLKSYTIDESDLKNYEAKNAFESGKVDPFSDYQEPVSNTVTNTTTSGGTPVTNTTTTNTVANTTNTNSGTFFEKSNSK